MITNFTYEEAVLTAIHCLSDTGRCISELKIYPGKDFFGQNTWFLEYNTNEDYRERDNNENENL